MFLFLHPPITRNISWLGKSEKYSEILDSKLNHIFREHCVKGWYKAKNVPSSKHVTLLRWWLKSQARGSCKKGKIRRKEYKKQQKLVEFGVSEAHSWSHPENPGGSQGTKGSGLQSAISPLMCCLDGWAHPRLTGWHHSPRMALFITSSWESECLWSFVVLICSFELIVPRKEPLELYFELQKGFLEQTQLGPDGFFLKSVLDSVCNIFSTFPSILISKFIYNLFVHCHSLTSIFYFMKRMLFMLLSHLVIIIIILFSSLKTLLHSPKYLGFELSRG